MHKENLPQKQQEQMLDLLNLGYRDFLINFLTFEQAGFDLVKTELILSQMSNN